MESTNLLLEARPARRINFRDGAPATLNVATSPMTVISKEESTEDGMNPETISAMRKQMMDFESVVTLKGDVDEQYELLKEQKEQLLQKSLETANLLEEMRNSDENHDAILESLKRGYEEALANANAALTNQFIASNNQIRRLESLLIKQQVALTKLGAVYTPKVKMQSRLKTEPTTPMYGVQGKKSLPIERRYQAYTEELTDSSGESIERVRLRPNRSLDSYVSQLEDEVLNLRIYLASEEELRNQIEKDLLQLQVQLKNTQNRVDGIDIEDEIELVRATSNLSIEEQNSSLQSVADKCKMICTLNTLRRQVMEKNIVLEKDLRSKDGKLIIFNAAFLVVRQSRFSNRIFEARER